MNKSTIAITAFLAAAITIVSCKKEEEAKDTTKPTVTITLLTAKDSTGAYHDGMTVEYKIEASDETELHGVVTEIVRDEDGAEVFHLHDHDVDGNNYTYNGSIVLDNNHLHTNFTITATATDGGENEAVATENFHSHIH